MMRRRKRHSAVEIAVFAAALILAAFIGREAWKRRAPAAAEPVESVESSAHTPAVLTPSFPMPTGASRSRTETAVTAVPSLKRAGAQRRPAKAVPVPVPAPK